MKSSNCDHLSRELIFRALDEELLSAERFEFELHLAVCDHCRQELVSLRQFSSEIDAAVQSVPIPQMEDGLCTLQKALESLRPAAPVVLQHPSKVMRRFGWGIAIAATLAFGVLIAPKLDNGVPQIDLVEPANHVASFAPSAAIEVDGESFVPVPYSNADLPISAPHIVQMQVPISSLAEVGIVLEPVNNRVGGVDGGASVLADVLVGADGQPRGVHVLGFD